MLVEGHLVGVLQRPQVDMSREVVVVGHQRLRARTRQLLPRLDPNGEAIKAQFPRSVALNAVHVEEGSSGNAAARRRIGVSVLIGHLLARVASPERAGFAARSWPVRDMNGGSCSKTSWAPAKPARSSPRSERPEEVAGEANDVVGIDCIGRPS